MIAERGDRVRVRVYGGDVVERIVWNMTETGVAITTEEEYRHAIQFDLEPPIVGFRWEFVVANGVIPDDPAL